MFQLRFLSLSAFATFAPLAFSQTVTSYDMLNGNGVASGGNFNYWDLDYSGSGQTNVDNSPLSGGLGDLTDGVVATDNWFNVENTAGTGPYVGWRFADPSVVFHFAGVTPIGQVTVYSDDSDHTGGVNLLSGVVINGTFFDVDENSAGSEPKALVFSGLGLVTDTVELTFVRSDEWAFVSEVQFDAIPEPVTLLTLGAALLVSRRRRSNTQI